MGRSAQNKRSSGNAANKSNASGADAGLVGGGSAGKRALHKARSNGQLNGTSPGTPGVTIAATNSTSSYPHANGRPETRNGTKQTKLEAPAIARRASLGNYSESSSSESYQASSAMAIPHEQSQIHRRIDVNSAQNPAVHRDTSTMGLLITVLRSCPLYDTIAILIVLLQIPPTFLTLIHLLFATLTFVPPSTGANSSFGFQDIFEGSLGTPSVATLLAFDVLILSIWLFLSAPLQDIFLDLAQIAIALTLGGGTQGRDAGINNLLVCGSIVLASHYVKGNKDNKPSKWFSFMSGNVEEDGSAKKGGFVWVRTIVAVHILTQGLVRYGRDWYLRREGRIQPGNPAFDSEGGHMAVLPDGTPIPSTAVTTPDGDALNPKKKRKASAQVRTRQPLWSALASTKIVMAKEYETSRNAAESAGTNATDINNLGNAPFSNEADRIWITYVGIDEVSFATSSFSVPDSPPNNPEADLSKPFFVRVNKTLWQPTRINPIDSPSNENANEIRWSGEIFGLAPFSNYDIEFVSTLSGETIYETSIRTLPAPIDTSSLNTNNVPTIITTSLPRVSSRPDSPTTTLRTSIQSAEAKLAEEKARQKREKKELKSKLQAVRKEIERLSASVTTSGSNDDKLRMKVVQSQLHSRQAEEAVVGMEEEIGAMEDREEDIEKEFTKNKVAMQAEKDAHKKDRRAFEDAKEAAEREITAVANETQSLQQKKDRFQSRLIRLHEQYERLADANKTGLDEVQRRERERVAKEENRERQERQYAERVEQQLPQIKQIQEALQNLWATVQGLELQQQVLNQQAMNQQLAIQAQQAQYASQTVAASQPSPTAFDGTYPWAGGYNTAYSGVYPLSTMPYAGPNDVASQRRERGRSSSMLSGVSGFTLSDDEDAHARPKTANPQSTSTSQSPYQLASNGNGMGEENSRPGASDGSGSASGGSGNPSPHIQAGKTAGFKLKPPPGLGGVAVWRNPWDP